MLSQETIKVIRCRALTGYWERLRGLLGYASCAPWQGYYFPRCTAVHTWGMRFEIDVVALDEQYRIVAIKPALEVNSYWYVRGAANMLEIPAGAAAHWQLNVGDIIEIECATRRVEQ